MTRSGKSNILILGMLTVMFAATTAVGFYLEEQERHGRLRLEQQVAQLTKAKQQLEQDLDGARRETTRLEEEASAAQEEARLLTAKVNEISQSRDTLQGEISKRDETLDQLNKELGQIRTEREQLNTQLASVQDESKRLARQLSQLRKERRDLEAKLAESKTQTSVELEKVVVKPQESSPPANQPPVSTSATGEGKMVTGRILVVNREYDFVVINVGKSNGVRIGDEFEVLRNGQSVGHVKVEKLYEALSAASLLPGTDKQNLHEGDTVRSAASGDSNS